MVLLSTGLMGRDDLIPVARADDNLHVVAVAAAGETCYDLVVLVGLHLIEHGHLDCLLPQDARGDSRVGSRAELGIGVCSGQDEPHAFAYNLKQLSYGPINSATSRKMWSLRNLLAWLRAAKKGHEEVNLLYEEM